MVVKAHEAAESCCCIALYLGSPAGSFKTQRLRHMALTWIISLTLFLNHVVDVGSAYRKRHQFCRLVSLSTLTLPQHGAAMAGPAGHATFFPG